MIPPPVNVLHRQPRLPLTPSHLLWAMVIGVLVMLASALVYLGFSGNPSISSGNADAQDMTMALGVTVGTTDLHTTPLGVFQTTNGGDTWALVAPGSAANND